MRAAVFDIMPRREDHSELASSHLSLGHKQQKKKMTKFYFGLWVFLVVFLSCSVYGFSFGICFMSRLPVCGTPVQACRKWSNKYATARVRRTHFQMQPTFKTRLATHNSIATVQTDFDLNRGAAVDTLLNDYPTLFERSCDFSIFTEEIVLEDVQGFRIEGLRPYRTFFTVVSSMVSLV